MKFHHTLHDVSAVSEIEISSRSRKIMSDHGDQLLLALERGVKSCIIVYCDRYMYSVLLPLQLI